MWLTKSSVSPGQRFCVNLQHFVLTFGLPSKPQNKLVWFFRSNNGKGASPSTWLDQNVNQTLIYCLLEVNSIFTTLVFSHEVCSFCTKLVVCFYSTKAFIPVQGGIIPVQGYSNSGGMRPQRRPFLERSWIDILCTQLYYISFIRVLDGGRWVIVGF